MGSKASALLLTLLMSVACASTSNTGTTATNDDPSRPAVTIQQLSTVAGAARHETGGVPVQYRINVTNRGAEPITLTRVAVTSMGDGAYNVNGSSSFNARIEPAEQKSVEMWAPANVANSTILGANGPVTLRATLYFTAPSGNFQHVTTQQVSGQQAGGS